MGWFNAFVSGLTGDSGSKVSQAHHQARDDSGVREGRDTEHFKSAPSDVVSHTESRIPLFPEGKTSDSSSKDK